MDFKEFFWTQEAIKFPNPPAAPTVLPKQVVPPVTQPVSTAGSGQAVVNFGVPHLGLMRELGISRPGHYYRAVKEYAAVQDFLRSGMVKNSDGSAPMYAPDAYPKYTFRSGSDVGYVFEIRPPDGHLNTPTHAGLDPLKKDVYKTAAEPTQKEHVTRIIEIKRIPLNPPRGGYATAQWKVIWQNPNN